MRHTSGKIADSGYGKVLVKVLDLALMAIHRCAREVVREIQRPGPLVFHVSFHDALEHLMVFEGDRRAGAGRNRETCEFRHYNAVVESLR